MKKYNSQMVIGKNVINLDRMEDRKIIQKIVSDLHDAGYAVEVWKMFAPDYWAVCGLTSLEDEPEKYNDFWKSKILGNIVRDKRNTALLREMGWTVIRFWKSNIRTETKSCVTFIEQTYQNFKDIGKE